MGVAISPILAAICFLTANGLRIAMYVQHIYRDHYDRDSRRDLDPEYLKQEWSFRESNDAMASASNVINAFAWCFFALPVVQVAWILSRGGTRRVGCNVALAIFAFAGVATELISRLMLFGSKSTALWVAGTFNLDEWVPNEIVGDEPDGMGWRSLEVTWLTVHGMINFVDSFEWVSLFLVMILIYYSLGTMQNRVMSMWWARFGLLIAFLCLFDLAAAVVVIFDVREYIQFAMVTGVLNTCIFLPIWCVMLACTLPQAKPTYQPGATTDTF